MRQRQMPVAGERGLVAIEPGVQAEPHLRRGLGKSERARRVVDRVRVEHQQGVDFTGIASPASVQTSCRPRWPSPAARSACRVRPVAPSRSCSACTVAWAGRRQHVPRHQQRSRSGRLQRRQQALLERQQRRRRAPAGHRCAASRASRSSMAAGVIALRTSARAPNRPGWPPAPTTPVPCRPAAPAPNPPPDEARPGRR